MKMLLSLTVALSALASPALTFAQTTSAPLTRAQVRADLIRLEQAGYDPSAGENVHYPDDIQAAEAKAAGGSAAQDVGGAVGGTSSAGASGSAADKLGAVGKATHCSGPAAFCNLYFGS